MVELLKMIIGIEAPFNMVVLIVMTVTVGTAIGAIAKETRKFFSLREDLEFKREMIARGVSIDEVERLIQAGRASSRSSLACAPRETQAVDC